MNVLNVNNLNKILVKVVRLLNYCYYYYFLHVNDLFFFVLFFFSKYILKLRHLFLHCNDALFIKTKTKKRDYRYFKQAALQFFRFVRMEEDRRLCSNIEITKKKSNSFWVLVAFFFLLCCNLNDLHDDEREK